MSITTVWSSLIFFGKVVQYVRLTADVYAIACFCYLIVLVLFDLASTQLSAAHWKRDWETRWKGKDALDSGTIVLLSKLNFISLFHPNNFQACSLIVVQEKRELVHFRGHGTWELFFCFCHFNFGNFSV